MSLRWRIYYGDGTVYDPGNPFDAPAQNVQMIANGDRNHGWSLARSNDYYWYEEDLDEWNGGDIFGLWDYLTRPGHKKVLFGRTILTEEFQAILTRAVNDPDIPQKTGWYQMERERNGVK